MRTTRWHGTNSAAELYAQRSRQLAPPGGDRPWPRARRTSPEKPGGNRAQHAPGLLDERAGVLPDLDVIDRDQVTLEVPSDRRVTGPRSRRAVIALGRADNGTGSISSSTSVVEPLAITASSRTTTVNGPQAVVTVAAVTGVVVTVLIATSTGASLHTSATVASDPRARRPRRVRWGGRGARTHAARRGRKPGTRPDRRGRGS